MITIVQADLEEIDHQAAILALTDAYAQDPMGNGKPLSSYAREHLLPGLRAHPGCLILLAFVEAEPAGLATCFTGFSTFAAKPLLNVHDLAVLPRFRGQGIGRRLLEAVLARAQQDGCCKVTLEVLEHNRPALQLYEALGFGQASYTAAAGGALFYARSVDGKEAK